MSWFTFLVSQVLVGMSSAQIVGPREEAKYNVSYQRSVNRDIEVLFDYVDYKVLKITFSKL